jgi:hypothetical protein
MHKSFQPEEKTLPAAAISRHLVSCLADAAAAAERQDSLAAG